MFYLLLLILSGLLIITSYFAHNNSNIIMGMIGLAMSDLILILESNSRIEAKLSEIDSNEEKVKELTAANKQLREAFDGLYYDTGDQMLDEMMSANTLTNEKS